MEQRKKTEANEKTLDVQRNRSSELMAVQVCTAQRRRSRSHSLSAAAGLLGSAEATIDSAEVGKANQLNLASRRSVGGGKEGDSRELAPARCCTSCESRSTSSPI